MVTIFFGVFIGLLFALAALDIEIGFNRLEFGPWTGSPRRGGVLADPYTKAALARSGELPVGGGEGLTFVADRDSTGQTLSPSCTYVIEGHMPPARYWTLTASTKDGSLFRNPARRYGYTSSEVLRASDGRVRLIASPLSQSGNWLPLVAQTSLRLTLRLYDTPLANETGGVAPVWPAILRGQCS